MGSCLSKKNVCVSSSSPNVPVPKPPEKLKSDEEEEEEEDVVKKEIFIIKHRKSHEVERQQQQQRSSDAEINGQPKKKPEQLEKGKNVISCNVVADGGAPLRTSSCTKEEVDAILIQCGRLSRSSSIDKSAAGRKYSGSKRSYDFDGENGNAVLDGDDDNEDERENQRRERHRQSQGRRRTPSRERERDQNQRSGSKERGGGRRVSRSPGRRSESPITSSNVNSRPAGKMVSVPATVSNGGDPVKRIQVKRNVGGSPRTRSPAARNENQNVNGSLSRSNSRKAEQSPYRRNPLAQIDTNIISQKPNADNNKTVQVPENNRNNSNNLITTNVHCKSHQEEQQHVALNVISSSVPENPKNQPLTRSRSSRLSRDLDNINPETLLNPNTSSSSSSSSSYTALLLEDIQNFHQKNTPPTEAAVAFTLPPCVTKARSILEAVADLNSSTGSNISSTPFSEQTNTIIKKTKPEMIIKDIPIMESEVVANNDDLMEPSFHKYVTVRRGTSGEEEEDDMEEQESSGSNSFVTGGSQQQHWGVSSSSSYSSSCWEPNSASNSSSRSFTTTTTTRQGMSESGKKVKKRDSQQNGIGRGRIGAKSSHMAGGKGNAAAVLT